MHQYKTIVQTLLVFSILNLVYAAPAAPQEVRDTVTGNDAEDVTTASGSDRRRGTPLAPDGTTSAGTTPPQYPSSLPDGGSPPQDSLPLDESALLQGSEPSSSGPASSSHLPLSATDGHWPVPVPVHDSTTEESSTSAHPLSAAAEPDGPAPVPDSNTEASTSSHQPVHVHDSTAEGSTSPHYTAVTYDMVDRDPPSTTVITAKKIAGFTFLAGTVAAIVIFSALHHNHNNQTGG